MFKKFYLVLAVLISAAPALSQSIQQSGTVTRGHVPYWVTSGVQADSGSSADSLITSLGVTNNGGAGFCVSSDRLSASGRNQLCFGASTNAAATISLQNYGTASAQNLNFVINGLTVPLPTGGNQFITGFGSFTPNHVPCFLNSGGVIQDCGLTLSTGGTVTSGIWQGTPVDIPFGGTNATTVSGARSNLGLGSMALQNSGSVSITGGAITGMSNPTVASDVANKSYVDATSTGLNILAASRLATAAVLPNTPTYSNGASGVGATLTAGSNTTLTVDGTTVNASDVVLVKNQAAPAQNGIYTLTTAGGGVPWVLTRATYFDQAAEMLKGSYTFITTGSTNANSSWTQQATVATVGTDPSTWAQFAAGNAGTVTNVATGAGLTGGPITGTGTISLASIASGNVMSNVSGSSAVPSATTPSGFTQGGFTGMSPCGMMWADNMGMAGNNSATQMFINNLDWAILCNGTAWVVGTGYVADGTAMRVINITSTSTNHRTVDISIGNGQGCTSPCVSTDSAIGGNDPDFPCAAQSVETDCYAYIVGTIANPPANNVTNNSWGLVLSRRDCHSGPGTTVQAAYPYYTCYQWNRTTGQTTIPNERWKWQIARTGTLTTIVGTGASKGAVTAIANGVKAQWTGLVVNGFVSPNAKAVLFTLHNTTASTVCAIAPDPTWSGSPYASTSGNNGNDWITTGMVATGAGQYGIWSTSGTCAWVVAGFTDSFGGSP